jgi:hypothetical protein
MNFMFLHKITKEKGRCFMKEVFLSTRDGLKVILEFTESNPLKAEELELFTFTEKPMELLDLLADLDFAIACYEAEK